MERLIELRDQILNADLHDILAHDKRLGELDIAVDARGGVVHISGTVPSEDTRQLVRRLLGRVRGVFAVWDVLGISSEETVRVVDIGCGAVKQHPPAVGIDRVSIPGVDVVAELEGGLPLADGVADYVFAVHILEHVHDLIAVMNDIHRVLKPSGILHVMSPNASAVNALADPTHVRFFNAQTFKYFCRSGPGVRQFWPLGASSSEDNVFADLQPIKDGRPPATEDILARFFN